MSDTKTNQITLTAMLVTMVVGATYIGIPSPFSFGGYMHIGTLVSFAIALKYGKKTGMLAGGIGATLFDLFSAYAIWWPGTLVTRLVMGYVVGWISKDVSGQGKNMTKNIIAMVVGGVVLIIGYFFYQAVFLGFMPGADESSIGFYQASLSIPGNMIQIVIGLFAVLLLQYLPETDVFE